jgi:hypothetical protein
MANEKTRFIKLNKNLKHENNGIFAKDSVLEVIAGATKFALPQVVAINAKDESGLPYPTDDFNLYSLAFKEEDVTTVEAMKKVSYSIPFGFGFGEDDGETLDLGLEDKYAEKDYTIDRDGNIEVKAGLKKEAEVGSNMLTDSNDKISTEFAEKVEGQDDPSYSEPWTADEKAMPAQSPILGELTAKAKELFKIVSGTEPNNLLPNNEDTSIDYNTAVDGSGTVSDPYKEDTKEMPWKDENLGQVSAQLKNALGEVGETVIKSMPSDGSAGGDNLDDYSIEGNVEEGNKDEFRPKEAGKAKLAGLEDQKMLDRDSMLPNAGDPTDDDFDISAEDLGLTPEQEQEALSSHGYDNPIGH